MRKLIEKFFIIGLMIMILGISYNTNVKIAAIAPPEPPVYNYKITCSGYVKDMNTGIGIPNVKVVLLELETGISQTVYTSSKGYYYVSITTPSYYQYKLEISKSGYVTQSTSFYFPQTYTYTFEMYPSGANVITCYGYVKSKAFGITIPGATIKLKEIATGIIKTTTSISTGYYYIKMYTTSSSQFTLYAIKVGYSTVTKDYSNYGIKNFNFNMEPYTGDVLISIRSINTNIKLKQGTQVDVIALCQGAHYNGYVYISIDGKTGIQMTRSTSDPYRFFALWNTAGFSTGQHLVNIYATDVDGNVIGSSEIAPVITNTYEMYLYYEIDYMTGFMPEQEVLDYWVAYWNSRAIKITYAIDNKVDYDSMLTEAEFWQIEKNYNSHYFKSYGTLSDTANGNVNNKVLYSQEKWIL